MTLEDVVLQGLSYSLESSSLEVRDAGRRKGRGVFAIKKIEKNEYLCEYRTTRVYHPRKREKYESEYDANQEGSYLLETQYGPKMVFDATRCYDQLGRYINHSSTHTNCRYWRPLLVRGKWRVGFVATRDIEEGEELLYDYGVRGASWMVSESPKKAAAGPRKFSLEQYRRRRFCPVPGCKVTKPLKKLSNHLTYSHPGLSKQDRMDFLARAKHSGAGIAGPAQTPSSSQASITSFFQSTPEMHHTEPRVDPAAGKKGQLGKKGKAPAVGRSSRMNESEDEEQTSCDECPDTSSTSYRAGSTRHYPSFEVSESPFLRSLTGFAVERFGLAMTSSQAAELLSDVSKYLYFAGHGKESSHNLYNTDRVKSYLLRLESDSITCSGQLTKLQRIETALRFAKLHHKWAMPQVEEAIQTFSLWKKRLQRERTAVAKKRVPRLSEDLQELGNYTAILTMSEPLARVQRALSGPNPPEPSEFDAAMAYIALHFYLTCTQRKSVVENLTMAEYAAATEEEEGHWIISVSQHKTASSSGPAHLVMNSQLKKLCDEYLVFRKELGSCPNFLVNHKGQPPTKLPHIVQSFAKQYDVRFPTPTQLRKAVGTAACELKEGQQEKVASFMKHSLSTQRRYYRALESQKNSLEAYKIVNRALLPRPSGDNITLMPRKRTFTDSQETSIREYFKVSIESASPISLRAAAQFLDHCPMEGRTPKHIQDKIRTFIRQLHQQH